MKKEIGNDILIVGGIFILLNIIFILIFLQINTSLLFQLLLAGISTTIFYSIKIAIAKKNNDAIWAFVLWGAVYGYQIFRKDYELSTKIIVWLVIVSIFTLISILFMKKKKK